MEFKIFLLDRMNMKKGRWFSLPSHAAEQYVKKLEDKGHFAMVMETDCDFDIGDLASGKTVAQLNELAAQLSELPALILDNLEVLLEYESLEEMIESEGSHFKFHEGTTLEEVAEDLTNSGEIEEFWTENELHDYLNYEALGRDLLSYHPFFEGTDGMIEYRK